MRHNPHIGLTIKRWRWRLGWTQQQAADYMGVPMRTLACWEQGQQQPHQQGPIRKLIEISTMTVVGELFDYLKGSK